MTDDADRNRVANIQVYRAMCTAFDQEAPGFASGPGFTLANDFKEYGRGGPGSNLRDTVANGVSSDGNRCAS
ncbi:hypothetical protein E4U59_006771 [Claviceps monticola]|nr:hypothetical protein E4U59_006771 [Claviceps monticola]